MRTPTHVGDDLDYTTLADGTLYALERPTPARPRTPLSAAQALAAAQQALTQPGTTISVRGPQLS